MKRRPPLDDAEKQTSLELLASAFAALRSPDEVLAFLEDLCTPAELEAMADRWRVIPYLMDRVPYRDIHDETRVSVTTIGRVARTLDHGTGGYRNALRRVARNTRKVNP